MTEKVSEIFSDIDIWSTKDMIKEMFQGQVEAVAAIEVSINNIVEAANAAAERLEGSGRMVYVGAGTSGRLAVQDGAELTPTFAWPPERTVFCMAGGMGALTVSVEGAEDNLDAGAREMDKINLNINDVVIAVAASGSTPYTLGAVSRANGIGALTIGISNNPNTALLANAKHPILVETGSEIIAGSTRMKAGTTQKAILNMLSTAIMTKLGRVYKGLMVDMIVSNDKLEKRAINMVCEITNCSQEIAIFALQAADKHIKTAVLISLGKNLSESRILLNEVNGNLRHALEAINTNE
jgi:N-acetylmuramic acid 6-phosphate etherase